LTTVPLIVGLAVQSGKLNDIPHDTEHERFVVLAAGELKSGPGSAKGISYQNEKACLVTIINFGSSNYYISSNKVFGGQKTGRNARCDFKNTASI
jgi:hypothetical protein